MYLVIFDCDGTLVDSQSMIVEAMTRAFSSAGRPAPGRADILSIVGLSLEEAVARLAPDLAVPAVHGLAQAYREAFGPLRADPAHAEPMFPGARATLDALHAHDDMMLGIATGKSMRGVRHFLQHEGLEGRFVTIQTADNHPSKPHPSMVARAMAETGVGRERTVVVGDTSYDMEMARAAGTAAIGVSWGYHPAAALQAAGAEPVLADFGALLPHLNARWNLDLGLR